MKNNAKRQLILEVAVKIMAEKGKDASISEIARSAGVNDSLIYRYFKNKEDLMFHVAGGYIIEGIDIYLRHVEGIREPVSRLSKYIWRHLQFHDENLNYAKFAIFECRSRKSFFDHETFGHFIEWAQLLKKILEDGVRDGSFSSNLPVAVTRDAILGLLDIENIYFFTGHQTSATENFEGILQTVMHMVTDYQDRAEKPTEKRDAILTAAEAVFAENGYEKATTIQIAKAAGVSEPTLYEYFQNKEDILFSTLRYRLSLNNHMAKKAYEIKTPLSKLVRFIHDHFSIYLRQPEFVHIFVLDGIFNARFYESKAYADFENYMATLDRILDEGKADGSFRSDLDNRIIKNAFLGIFSHTALRWFFTKDRRRFEMLDRIGDVTSLLIRLIKHPNCHDEPPSSAPIR